MLKGTYTLLTDWNNDGDYGDTGEDVTARLLSLEWTRGRDYASQLTGRSVAGTLRATLNNESGDYSPFNSAGPLYGNLLPGRKVRLDGGTGSFPYTFPIVFNDKPHFLGFVTRIIPQPNVNGADTAILEAEGVLGYLASKKVSLAMATSLATGDAIDDILDDAGWAAADRSVDTGFTTMARFWLDRMDAVSAMREVEETENGFLWETMDGKVGFDDRHHRLTDSPHTTSQATFSDALAAARTYSGIMEEDPLPYIYNEFEATVQTYTVGGSATLWTLAESGASSPALAPGESRTWWATYPNPDSATNAFAVNAWTTLVSTTDYTANSASDGSGTDLTANITVALVKLGNAMKITLTNGAVVTAYITLLQARGTPVTADDPVRVRAEDSTSQTRYGERTYESRSRFLPDSDEAQDWARVMVGIYKDPIPLLGITVIANRDHTHLVEVLTRDIGDRVTITANRTAGANLGINEDFFIESERHYVEASGLHTVTWMLSPATGYSGFWVLDSSALGVTTKLMY